MNNQKPSTLGLLKVEDEDNRLPSCLSSSSNERVEHARGGNASGKACGRLDGETDCRAPDGGDGEKLNLGAGWIMPLRLGDLDMSFPLMNAGSCRGNRQECFMS